MRLIFITDFHKLYHEKGLNIEVIKTFQKILKTYYKQHGRKFSFREKINPYHVLVSEIMLQQTQTSTVSDKFLEFIEKFPNFKTLAEAPLDQVIETWQGLGYNRRAIALKTIAEKVINEYDGILPDSIEPLKNFAQIGKNTASSILAFAFNKPTVFIETNIRRVYIYFFFSNETEVSDNDILPLVEATIDKSNPREWYYALMDYGVMLKKKYPNLNKRSAHYRKQAPFKGSNREIRGKILKLILKHKRITESELMRSLKNLKQKKIRAVLNQLEKEGFIKVNNSTIRIPD